MEKGEQYDNKRMNKIMRKDFDTKHPSYMIVKFKICIES